MKNKKFFILLTLFIILIVISAVIYSSLSKDYKPETPDLPQVSYDEAEPTPQQTIPETPDFTVYDTNGNAVNLSDFFGKPIVINFWATWCGPCKYELPSFDLLHKQYGDEVNFLMVNLTDGNRETVEKVKSFITENNYTFPVYYDTDFSAANAYYPYSIPLTIFIDSQGNIVGSYTGAMDQQTLTNYVLTLKGGDTNESNS